MFKILWSERRCVLHNRHPVLREFYYRNSLLTIKEKNESFIWKAEFKESFCLLDYRQAVQPCCSFPVPDVSLLGEVSMYVYVPQQRFAWRRRMWNYTHLWRSETGQHLCFSMFVDQLWGSDHLSCREEKRKKWGTSVLRAHWDPLWDQPGMEMHVCYGNKRQGWIPGNGRGEGQERLQKKGCVWVG